MGADETSWLISRLRVEVETRAVPDDQEVARLLDSLPGDDGAGDDARRALVDIAAALIARSARDPIPPLPGASESERRQYVLRRLESKLDRYLAGMAAGSRDAPEGPLIPELLTARAGEYSPLITNLAMPLARRALERALRPEISPEHFAAALVPTRAVVARLLAGISLRELPADGDQPRGAFVDPLGTIPVAVEVLLDPDLGPAQIEFAAAASLWLAARLGDRSLDDVAAEVADIAARRRASATPGAATAATDPRHAILTLVQTLASLGDPACVNSGALRIDATHLTTLTSSLVVQLAEPAQA